MSGDTIGTTHHDSVDASPDPIFGRPYLLLTPGPLSTTATVRQAMGRDWCTWDTEYNVGVVTDVRRRIEAIADPSGSGALTVVPMQGSGTAAVEATITSVVPRDGRLLVVANGHYGMRMAKIAHVAGIDCRLVDVGELGRIDPDELERVLGNDPAVTHVGFVHCETTTGRLNDLEALAAVVRRRGLVLIVDAMSSFGGMPIDVIGLGIDFLVSSANKCIQGVPGVGFVVAKRSALQQCEGRARSLSLDLYDQWRVMDEQGGKWRFTSPTHVVRALHQALIEFETEGGIDARNARYRANHDLLVSGMRALGFSTLVAPEEQSPFITAFSLPDRIDFNDMYAALKADGFVLYPGVLTDVPSFRIGTIGDVFPDDISRLLGCMNAFAATR